jgi:hypothetical protein
MNEQNQNVAVDTVAPAATEAAGFHNVVMKINERKGGKTVFKKFLPYGLATLDQAVEGLPAPDSWTETEVTVGEATATLAVPVYENSVLQYLQDAVKQRLEGLARSRDATGQLPCFNWTEVEESGGGAKYPLQLKQFREAFATWLATKELSEKQQAAILSYTDTKKLLEQADHKKERVAVYFSEFVTSMGDAAAEVASVVRAINSALDTTPEDVDF